MEVNEIQNDSIQPPFPKKNETKTPEALNVVQKDLATYVASAMYGCWETLKVMRPETVPGVGMASEELTSPRAQEGIKKLFEQNVGDGTIVALGFFGSEAILQTVDIVSRKLGKKGINPKIRFLTSLAFGIGLAIYLETTKFMGNTVDIPGDLFGVALGAAAILTGKVINDRLTRENLTKLRGGAVKFMETSTKKLDEFSRKISVSINKKDVKSLDPQGLATEFTEIINPEGS